MITDYAILEPLIPSLDIYSRVLLKRTCKTTHGHFETSVNKDFPVVKHRDSMIAAIEQDDHITADIIARSLTRFVNGRVTNFVPSIMSLATIHGSHSVFEAMCPLMKEDIKNVYTRTRNLWDASGYLYNLLWLVLESCDSRLYLMFFRSLKETKVAKVYEIIETVIHIEHNMDAVVAHAVKHEIMTGDSRCLDVLRHYLGYIEPQPLGELAYFVYDVAFYHLLDIEGEDADVLIAEVERLAEQSSYMYKYTHFEITYQDALNFQRNVSRQVRERRISTYTRVFNAI